MSLLKAGVLLMVISLFVGQGFAKTLIISDIDDTIKNSHVLDFLDSVDRSSEQNLPVTGMSEFYNLLKQQLKDDDVKIIYVSTAPSEIMLNSHRKHLSANHFPKGDLFLPSMFGSRANFKFKTISEVLSKYQPDQVIAIGDNGEKDAFIYKALKEANRDIRWSIFIRNVYYKEEFGADIHAAAQFYVSPFEISARLENHEQLNSGTTEKLKALVLDRILKQDLKQSEGGLLIPEWMECQQWKWPEELSSIINSEPLKEHLQNRCHE